MLQIVPKATVQVDVSGRMLARNTLFNLVGQVAPLSAAVLTTPYVIHHLGPERYGLYSLAWFVVGYFALFNLGIGPATTKHFAELLGSGETGKLPELVWTAVASQALLGSIGGILLAVASPFLVEHVLKIPAGLHSEACEVFLIMAAALPMDFIGGSVQGILGASQRFDLLNAINIPFGFLTYLAPVMVLASGFGLVAIVLSLVLIRVATSAVILAFGIRLYPALRSIRLNHGLVRSLLKYGGWITISDIAGPVLVYFDRFLIATLISVTAVGFYTPSYLIASKMWILPSSLGGVLFPAFSASAGRGDQERIKETFVRSLKLLFLLIGPATLVLIFSAHSLLFFWLGERFADEGALVLQILAVGAFVNSLARVPSVLLQGTGHPDLTAKFHLAELPIHLVLTWVLVTRLGLPGAALAWTAWAILDFLLLIFGICRVTRISARHLFSREIGRGIAALAVFAIGLSVLSSSNHILLVNAALTSLLSGGFLMAAWHYALNREEKWQITSFLKVIR